MNREEEEQQLRFNRLSKVIPRQLLHPKTEGTTHLRLLQFLHWVHTNICRKKNIPARIDHNSRAQSGKQLDSYKNIAKPLLNYLFALYPQHNAAHHAEIDLNRKPRK